MSTAAAYDELSAAAATGAMPLIVAVVATPAEALNVAEWLESGVPAFGPLDVSRVGADALLDGVDQPGPTRIVVVPDATAGAPAALTARWALWDLRRERLLGGARRNSIRAIVLLGTEAPFMEVAPRSRNLLSAAAIFSVSRQESLDDETLAAYRSVLEDLEARYGIATSEVVAKTLARQDVPVPDHDLARWLAAIRALQAHDS